VDEDVEPASEGVGDLGEDPVDVLVGADVAGGDEWAVDALGQIADARLDSLALEGEREPRAARREPPRDRPCDRALVRDAENQSGLSLEID
jgi:hypothetical protein